MQAQPRRRAEQDQRDGRQEFREQQRRGSGGGQPRERRTQLAAPEPQRRAGDHRDDGGTQSAQGGGDPAVLPAAGEERGERQDDKVGGQGDGERRDQRAALAAEAQAGQDREVDDDDARHGLGDGVGLGDFLRRQPAAPGRQFRFEHGQGGHAAAERAGADPEKTPENRMERMASHGCHYLCQPSIL